MLYTSYFIMLTFIFVIGKYRGSYFKYRLVIFTYTQTEKNHNYQDPWENWVFNIINLKIKFTYLSNHSEILICMFQGLYDVCHLFYHTNQ